MDSEAEINFQIQSSFSHKMNFMPVLQEWENTRMIDFLDEWLRMYLVIFLLNMLT